MEREAGVLWRKEGVEEHDSNLLHHATPADITFLYSRPIKWIDTEIPEQANKMDIDLSKNINAFLLWKGILAEKSIE